jgi:hypothetical protein
MTTNWNILQGFTQAYDISGRGRAVIKTSAQRKNDLTKSYCCLKASNGSTVLTD